MRDSQARRTSAAMSGSFLSGAPSFAPAKSKRWKFGAAAAGVLDMSVVLAHAYAIDLTVWYASTLAVKAVLLAFAAEKRSSLQTHYAAVGALAALILGNAVATGTTDISLLQASGFVLHLAFTLGLVSRASLGAYLGAAALAASAAALVHLSQIYLGSLTQFLGRYRYLGNTHPNLGGEINAMSCIAAAIAFRNRRTFIIVAIILFLSTLVMQSRAAMGTIIGCAVLRMVFRETRTIDSTRLVLSIVSYSTLLLGLAILLSDQLKQSLSTLFLLDDRRRGLETGFVGRDDRWALAYDTFLQKPVFGAGVGYFEANSLPAPHSFPGYALAETGLVGCGMLVFAMAYIGSRALKFSPRNLLLASPIAVLLLLNDRFININPYPFILFVLLIVSCQDDQLPQIEKSAAAPKARWRTARRDPAPGGARR